MPLKKQDLIEENVEEYIVTVVKGGFAPKKIYKSLEEAEVRAIQVAARTKNKVIDVNDWDDLVVKTYEKSYSFQQQDECKSRGVEYITVPCEPEDYENDTLPEVVNGEEMGVSFEFWLKRNPKTPLSCTFQEAKDCGYFWGESEEDLKKWQYDKSHIDMFYDRNFYPHVSMIINNLYSKGLLEKGEYLINIAW